MFILTKIADLVQIAPEDFSKDAAQAIEDNINAKYANKVIQKIGLCICLYDLLDASEGLIGHGNGLVNVNVEFRLVVFRPFKHEVLIGRISSAVLQGIRIRLPFFDEIFVPAHLLPQGSKFDPSTQQFVWHLEGGEKLYFDKHEAVRFQIDEEHWFDQTPVGPSELEEDVKKSPYTLTASMLGDGLGVCMWWDDNDAVAQEE